MTGFPSLINNTLGEEGQLPPVNEFAPVMSPKNTEKNKYYNSK